MLKSDDQPKDAKRSGRRWQLLLLVPPLVLLVWALLVMNIRFGR